MCRLGFRLRLRLRFRFRVSSGGVIVRLVIEFRLEGVRLKGECCVC